MIVEDERKDKNKPSDGLKSPRRTILFKKRKKIAQIGCKCAQPECNTCCIN